MTAAGRITTLLDSIDPNPPRYEIVGGEYRRFYPQTPRGRYTWAEVPLSRAEARKDRADGIRVIRRDMADLREEMRDLVALRPFLRPKWQ